MRLFPTRQQLEFLDWEFGVFFHFGIRSFYPGHRDWDGIEMPPERFCPEELDCGAWVRAARDAGAKYAILTAKHHDGFALWPSRYSRYSVADTPWKGGQGDVVREFTDACRAGGLKVGLYYSPAQWGSRSIPFDQPREYDDFFLHQIGELLTNYGKIDYLWFDGCGSEGHEYDKARIVAEIQRMQPGLLTFCDPEWAPGVRWVGNEDGYVSLRNPLVVSGWDFSELSEGEQALSRPMFLPNECDAKIRDTWFYDLNEETLKSLEELWGMYLSSVGRGSNFLLNIGPDARGLLPEADAHRLKELGDRIRTAFSRPVVCTSEILYDVLTLTPERPSLASCVVLREDLTEGQGIEGFEIWGYLPVYRTKKVLLYCGKTVGHKVICRFPAIRASKLEIRFCHEGPYRVRDAAVFAPAQDES